MKENVLLIDHTEYATEEFEIIGAEYNVYESEDGIWEFVIRFETDPIKRSKKLAEVVDVCPNFEATALLKPDELDLFEGRVIRQEKGYDYERDQHLSNIYYFEHNNVEALEVEIVEYNKDWIIVEGKAKAIINGGLGDEPDADLIIRRTKFVLDEEMERDSY